MPTEAGTSAARGSVELGRVMRQLVRVGSEELHRRIAQCGHPEIRPPHRNALQVLDEDGTPLTELARRAQVTKQAMTEVVDHLERHAYVERVPDPRDGRAKLVRATALGKEASVIIRAAITELEQDWTKRLGAHKTLQLRALLQELTECLAPNDVASRAPGSRHWLHPP
jgi:DNA-binding MarR family transcriptional regulator